MPENKTLATEVVIKQDESQLVERQFEQTRELAKELTQTQPTQSTAIVPAGTPMVVRNSIGPGTRTVMRGEHGRFVKTQKQLQRDLDVAAGVEAGIQRLLQKPATDKEGKPLVDAHGKPIPKYLAAVERLLDMITSLSEQKAIGSAGKALEGILTRALGSPAKSPKERMEDRISPVRTVFIVTPAVTEGPAEPSVKPKQPSFAQNVVNAEIVSTNDPVRKRGRRPVLEGELVVDPLPNAK